MAEMVFMGEYDLEEAKHSFDKPTVMRYIRSWFENESRGESRGKTSTEGTSYSEGATESSGHTRSRGSSSSFGESFSEGDSSSEGESEQYDYDPNQPSLFREQNQAGWGRNRSSSLSSSKGRFSSQSESISESESYSSSTSNSRTDSKSFGRSFTESFSRGRSEGLEPILEIMPTQGYSLEEQIYKSMALMINQPTQNAIVKLPGKASQRIRTPDILDGYANDRRVENFKQEVLRISSFTTPAPEVELSIQQRRQLLTEKAQEHFNPKPPESFRE